MKSFIVIILGLVLGTSLNAQQEINKKKSQNVEETVTGEIIDIKCYTTGMMGGRGADHADCASSCIKGGLPVGVVQDKTDEVYVVIPAKGMKGANEDLLPFVAKRVTLKGKIIKKGGVKIFAYASIAEIK